MQLVSGVPICVRTSTHWKKYKKERVLKIPHELHKLSGYKERLSAVGLTTLEERRDRGDLIQAYKLINGLEIVSDQCLPKRAHYLKTDGPASALRKRNNLERESFKAKMKNDYSRGNNHQASLLHQQSRPPLELTTQLRDLDPDTERV